MKKIILLFIVFSLYCSGLSAFPIIYGGSGGGGEIADGTATGQMAFWDNIAGTWTHTEVTELFFNDTNKTLLFSAGAAATPSVAIGASTLGIYGVNAATMGFSASGAKVFTVDPSGISFSGGSARLLNEVSSATNPTICPANTDSDTGIGSAAVDQLSLIAGGVEGIRIVEDTNILINFNGSVFYQTTTVNSATYDLTTADYILNVTYTSTGAVTSLTLPTAQAVNGRVIHVKDAAGNASTYTITIDTEGAEKIDGADTKVLNTDYESISMYCDGTNWFVY